MGEYCAWMGSSVNVPFRSVYANVLACIGSPPLHIDVVSREMFEVHFLMLLDMLACIGTGRYAIGHIAEGCKKSGASAAFVFDWLHVLSTRLFARRADVFILSERSNLYEVHSPIVPALLGRTWKPKHRNYAGGQELILYEALMWCSTPLSQMLTCFWFEWMPLK